jgi:capsular exopolysaccharide synthesis family protein
MRRNAAAVLREKQGKDAERLRMLEEMEKKLQDEIEKLASDVKTDARRGVELESLKEQIESTDKISQRLHQMIDEEQINITAPDRIARLGNDPTPDVRRTLDEKKQAIIAGGAGAAAMALVFLVIAYWEFLARRIITGDDVIYGLGWRLVGAIPDLPSRQRRNPTLDGESHKHWNSLLTESVDAARALLLRTARTEAVRTVMVTSAVAGEGKTSLSCHLASSLARAGRKTLLIDGDLRRPSVHQLFDMPVEPGFSGVLRGDVDLSEVIRPTPAKNLWVVPAGQCDVHTLEALAQEALASVLARVKEQFDFILIDSSPVLPVADALIIGQHVDGVLFSLLRDVSRFPNVYAAYERLSSLGIRMLGAVVNGVRQDRYGYSYQYYYNKDHN